VEVANWQGIRGLVAAGVRVTRERASEGEAGCYDGRVRSRRIGTLDKLPQIFQSIRISLYF